jgi:hypothetical protein
VRFAHRFQALVSARSSVNDSTAAAPGIAATTSWHYVGTL